MNDRIDNTVTEGGVSIDRLVIQHDVYYAVQPPVNGLNDETIVVVAAHGYGQSCKGFIRNFAQWGEENVLVVAPQGPNQFYWQDTGKVGFAWMTSYGRENTIPRLMEYMGRLLDVVRDKYVLNPDRIFTLGFSQGTAMAFRLAASGVVPVRGVIACGGDLPPDVAERLDAVEKFPSLLVHGKEDPAMSFEKCVEGEKILREHGYKVNTFYFDGYHDLPDDHAEVSLQWMQDQL